MGNWSNIVQFSSYVKIERCQNMDSCFTTISPCDVNVSSDLKHSHCVNTLENNELTRPRKLMKDIRLRKSFPMVINTVKQWLGTADLLVEELCRSSRDTYFLNDHLFWHSPFTNTVLFESLRPTPITPHQCYRSRFGKMNSVVPQAGLGSHGFSDL